MRALGIVLLLIAATASAAPLSTSSAPPTQPQQWVALAHSAIVRLGPNPVVFALDDRHAFSALDAASGRVLWRKPSTLLPLLCRGRRLLVWDYAASVDGIARLLVLDTATGRVEHELSARDVPSFPSVDRGGFAIEKMMIGVSLGDQDYVAWHLSRTVECGAVHPGCGARTEDEVAFAVDLVAGTIVAAKANVLPENARHGLSRGPEYSSPPLVAKKPLEVDGMRIELEESAPDADGSLTVLHRRRDGAALPDLDLGRQSRFFPPTISADWRYLRTTRYFPNKSTYEQTLWSLATGARLPPHVEPTHSPRFVVLGKHVLTFRIGTTSIPDKPMIDLLDASDLESGRTVWKKSLQRAVLSFAHAYP